MKLQVEFVPLAGVAIALLGKLVFGTVLFGDQQKNSAPRRSFQQVLVSNSKSSDIPNSADLYGWLVGSWDVDVFDIDDDGTRHQSRGEWHFAWVLEGRAIQDVFIVSEVSERSSRALERNRYGTTVRMFDPKSQTWKITWMNPVNLSHNVLVAHKEGDEIVQVGEEDGNLIRWIFSEIKPDSFRWTGELSSDQGKTWRLGAEFFGHRIGSN
jgi:hypothetical protein